jgi:protein-tyrosine-phosphatase
MTTDYFKRNPEAGLPQDFYRLISRKEVRKIFNRSTRTIQRWEDDGQLPMPIPTLSGRPVFVNGVIIYLHDLSISGQKPKKGDYHDVTQADIVASLEAEAIECIKAEQNKVVDAPDLAASAFEAETEQPLHSHASLAHQDESVHDEASQDNSTSNLFIQLSLRAKILLKKWILHPDGGLTPPAGFVVYCAAVVILVYDVDPVSTLIRQMFGLI